MEGARLWTQRVGGWQPSAPLDCGATLRALFEADPQAAELSPSGLVESTEKQPWSVIARASGRVSFVLDAQTGRAANGRLEILSGDQRTPHEVGEAVVAVMNGQHVEAGTPLTQGPWSPFSLFGAIPDAKARRAVVDEFLRLFGWAGAYPEEVFVEVLVRRMTMSKEGEVIGIFDC